MLQIDKNVFDPSLLSFSDCDYLLQHAGEAPIVALRDLNKSSNPVLTRQWIERFYELDELQRASAGRFSWEGVEAVKKSIQVYLDQRKKWDTEHRLYGAPKFPSLYAFDSRGNGHLGAAGSDNSRVKSYFDENGNRLPFAINLLGEGTTAWKPEWITKKVQAGEKAEVPQLIEVEAEHCWKCGVKGCGHTEVYKPNSRASRAAARARMSKHLRKPQFEQETHLELYTLEFGTADV